MKSFLKLREPCINNRLTCRSLFTMLHWSQPSIVCQEWLRNYQNDHRHPTNHLIHCFGIPLIFMSLIGLLNLLNINGYGLGNWSLVLISVFYLIHDTKASVIVIPLMVVAGWFSSQLGWLSLGVIFLLSWVIQVIGHRIYDKNNPSTLKSLIYLLIAPLYLVRFNRKQLL
jgi:uncharacterized membrane protein YGL010W